MIIMALLVSVGSVTITLRVITTLAFKIYLPLKRGKFNVVGDYVKTACKGFEFF